eukprot:1484983-Prymnesium_polylepis.1
MSCAGPRPLRSRARVRPRPVRQSCAVRRVDPARRDTVARLCRHPRRTLRHDHHRGRRSGRRRREQRCGTCRWRAAASVAVA